MTPNSLSRKNSTNHTRSRGHSFTLLNGLAPQPEHDTNLPSTPGSPVSSTASTENKFSENVAAQANAKEKSAMARLTRMFSQSSKKPVAENGPAHASGRTTPMPKRGEKETDYVSSDTEGMTSRGSSVAEDHPVKRNVSHSSTKNGEAIHYVRFEMTDDGLHLHHLRAAKRQEKLTTLLQNYFRRKPDEEEKPANHQLSLMHSWADQVKREKVANLKKESTASATLVEKYGRCQEIIGRGAFGVVRISHKADPTDASGEQLYAVKEFRRRPQESLKKYTKRLTSEFCISSSLRHSNVIHTLDLLLDAKGDWCEVMEYCAGGDLYTLILAAGKLEGAEADCYFKQLMAGVNYLHEQGVAHRDLKPENLLLTQQGCLKITDFGNGECFRMAWEKEAHLTAGLCGSAPYIAPEEYTDKEFDPRAVDVWATGVIYMAMRTGRHLWRMAKRDEDEFYERYLEGRRDEPGYEPIESLQRVPPSKQSGH
jgi:protein-serine/threonine kinase